MSDRDQLLRALTMALPPETGDSVLRDHGVREEARNGDDRSGFVSRHDAGDCAVHRGGGQHRDGATALGEHRADMRLRLASGAVDQARAEDALALIWPVRSIDSALFNEWKLSFCEIVRTSITYSVS